MCARGAYSRSWHKHDARQRRQPPFASSNGILVDVFSAILSRAALRNIYARRGAGARARVFPALHSTPPALPTLFFFPFLQVPTSSCGVNARSRLIKLRGVRFNPSGFRVRAIRSEPELPKSLLRAPPGRMDDPISRHHVRVHHVPAAVPTYPNVT